MDKIGDFQENVGKVSGDLREISTKIGGVFVIIIGIALLIWGIIPSRLFSNNFNCPCSNPNQKCVDGKCVAKKKAHIWIIIGGVCVILFGFGIIWIGKLQNEFVHKNRTNAQMGAVFTEAGLVSNMLHKNQTNAQVGDLFTEVVSDMLPK